MIYSWLVSFTVSVKILSSLVRNLSAYFSLFTYNTISQQLRGQNNYLLHCVRSTITLPFGKKYRRRSSLTLNKTMQFLINPSFTKPSKFNQIEPIETIFYSKNVANSKHFKYKQLNAVNPRLNKYCTNCSPCVTPSLVELS